MNGNANLNANNLTPQNVQDWRNKLKIKDYEEEIILNKTISLDTSWKDLILADELPAGTYIISCFFNMNGEASLWQPICSFIACFPNLYSNNADLTLEIPTTYNGHAYNNNYLHFRMHLTGYGNTLQTRLEIGSTQNTPIKILAKKMLNQLPN